MTADEIQREGSFDEPPYFGAFDGEYDTYLNEYQGHLGKLNPQFYHPCYAQPKVTKSGVKVSREDVQIRRSCKALMSFMMYKRNKRIHFIVDNIQEDNRFTDVERRHVKKYRLYSNTNFKAYSGGKEVGWPWKGA